MGGIVNAEVTFAVGTGRFYSDYEGCFSFFFFFFSAFYKKTGTCAPDWQAKIWALWLNC